MYKGKSILGIIPARGGSKRLPKKNIRLLFGKPLIAWTIEQALASRYIDRLIVSTDDPEIATVAKQHGAEIPFLRSKKLASDNAKQIDVIFHALRFFKKKGFKYDVLIALQPTSPLRLSQDINRSIEALFFKKRKAIISVCESEDHHYWANCLPKNHSMANFLSPWVINKNKQELPTSYRINGAICVAHIDFLKEEKSFFGKSTYAYIMPKERSIDIDEEADLLFGELMMKRNKDEQKH